MIHVTRSLAVLTMVVMTAGASVSAEQWEVDPDHSSVIFSISHMDVSHLHGRFNDIGGTVSTGDAPAFAFNVRADSIDTHNAKRDDILRGPDFFNARQFPTITFASTTATANEGGYELTGDVTLHGVTRPTTVQVVKVGEGDDPWGNHRIGFSTTFKVNRSDFGMKNMPKMVGDEVTLIVNFEAIRQ